jgi:signal transduction histidine kinase
MPARLGFRTRATLTIAAFSVLLLVAQSVAVVILTYQQEDNLVNQLLDNQVHSYEEQIRRGITPDLPNSDQFQGYLIRTPAERSRLPTAVRDLPPGTVEIKREGRVLHVLVRPMEVGTLYLVYDATPHEDRVREFSHLMLLAVFTMAVVTALLGYWVAELLVRQVTDLSGRVARLGREDDALPAPAEYRDKEIASLARVIGDYHRRTNALIRREKEFTANVSHELRTPLTAIKTGCELLAQESGLSDKTRARIGALATAATRMEESIQALLLLARETTFQAGEAFSVRETVEETLASLKELLQERPDVRLEIDIDPGAAVHTSRTAFQLAVTNLLKNAIAHTRRGRIRLGYDAGVLEVSDTGSGIAEHDLPRIFERFYRGGNAVGNGHTGLGLAIVRSIADQLGWQIEVESRSGEGTLFRITLPLASGLSPTPPAEAAHG